jgi:serine/threonine-protein kinase
LLEEFINSPEEWMIRGYRLTELLECGAVTALYRATTEELWLPPEVLIRVFHLPKTWIEQSRKAFRKRFMNEARRIVRLRHSSLFPLFGYGEQDGILYLVMPAMPPGETLATRLERSQSWSLADAFALLAPIAEALEVIHSHGLVYQFLHPGNILLVDGMPPHILDLSLTQMMLNLSSSTSSGSPTTMVHATTYEHLKDISGVYVGRPEYLAPEVVRGLPPDARSDVYSLGIMLFTLLAGQPPFRGEQYQEIVQKHLHEPLPLLHACRPVLPLTLDIIVNRALHRNPARRFQSPREFMLAYAHLIEARLEESTSSQAISTYEQIQSLPFPTITIDSPLWPYQQTFGHTTSLDPPIPLSSRTDVVNEAWLNSGPDDILDGLWPPQTADVAEVVSEAKEMVDAEV